MVSSGMTVVRIGVMLGAETLVDIEREAVALWRIYGHDPSRPAGLPVLVKQALGTSIRVANIPQEGRLHRVGGRWHITIKRGLHPARARHIVGHELAEWHYRRLGYRGEQLESRCDALGAAICAPKPLVERAVARFGPCCVRLAKHLRLQPSLCHLRLGEATGRPVALWSPERQIYRGDDYNWPELASAARDGHLLLRRVHLYVERWICLRVKTMAEHGVQCFAGHHVPAPLTGVRQHSIDAPALSSVNVRDPLPIIGTA